MAVRDLLDDPQVTAHQQRLDDGDDVGIVEVGIKPRQVEGRLLRRRDQRLAQVGLHEDGIERCDLSHDKSDGSTAVRERDGPVLVRDRNMRVGYGARKRQVGTCRTESHQDGHSIPPDGRGDASSSSFGARQPGPWVRVQGNHAVVAVRDPVRLTPGNGVTERLARCRVPAVNVFGPKSRHGCSRECLLHPHHHLALTMQDVTLVVPFCIPNARPSMREAGPQRHPARSSGRSGREEHRVAPAGTHSPGPVAAIESAVVELRTVGVVLCLIPVAPGLGIHGATRWLNGRPIIQLSLLCKSDDQLWFTLFHELGHVLLHGDKELYLNGDTSEAEDEANTFASDLLIPPTFGSRRPRTRDIAAVQGLTDELGIAPSIMLGRLQRETRDYAWGHGLKHKIVIERAPKPQET